MDQQNNGDPEHIDTKNIPTNLIAGACAGAIAKTTIAPLDRTKINFQVTSRKFSFKKAIRFMIESCKNHGIRSLWRGNTATIVRIAPYSAIQFTAHDYFKTVLHVNSKGKRKKKHAKSFLAGALAGITSTTITYPLDLARARMAVTQEFKYKSLYKVVKGQSLHSLYRGYVPTIIGVIPYAAISFYTYESLKAHYCDKTNNSHLHPLVRLCFGAVAGLLGQASSYPMDIVRRRMQTDVIIGNHYESIRHTVKSVVKNEGFIGGLYKGLSLNMIKGPIAAGISFMTNDLIRQLQIF